MFNGYIQDIRISKKAVYTGGCFTVPSNLSLECKLTPTPTPERTPTPTPTPTETPTPTFVFTEGQIEKSTNPVTEIS